VGFSEGDGSFVFRPHHSNFFEISQSSKDVQVLFQIKKHLGFGKVVQPPSKPNVAFFTVSKKEHLQILKLIFHSKIHTSNTLLRYNQFFCDNYSLLQVPDFRNAWFSGFIDAEACFRIKFEKNNTVKLIFELTQKDEKLIINCRNLFKSLKGNIRKDRSVYKLSFSGADARNQLIKYLNKFPLKSHKRIVYLKWFKAHQILEKKDVGWKEKIRKLSINLNKWREEENNDNNKQIKDIVRSCL